MKALQISCPEGYLHLLSPDGPESKNESKELAGLITTGESYFFRDCGQFTLLKTRVLPELIVKRKVQHTLRIWSAGCSTGEEPYSIAMLFDELLPDGKDWTIFLCGTDINENALEKAKRGRYSPWSFRMVDADIQTRYFTRHKEEWEIAPRIRKTCSFQYANLLDDAFPACMPELCDIDLILCRNVFIYFGTEAITTVLDKFIEILNDGGYLMTGHGELYGQRLRLLKPLLFPESVVYQKDPAILTSGIGIAKLPARQLPIDSTRTQTPRPKTGLTALPTPAHKSCKKDIQKPTFLMDQAWSYANSGAYDRAGQCCKDAINLDHGAAGPYFLLAKIAETKDDYEEAKTLLKKAVYLEPSFIAAYIELGAIHEKEGTMERAEKMRSTALELLGRLPPDAIVAPYIETAKELIDNISVYVDSKK